MKATSISCALALILGVTACNSSSTEKTPDATTETVTQVVAPKDSTPPAPPMDSAAMMKAWQDYMTPGDMHKKLASFNGTWNEEIIMWMGPDAPPEKSMGTTVNRMIMGGLYQESKHTGNMNGMPFEGQSVMGYDNAKKKFVSSWIDNMGSGIMYMEGTWNEATKSVELKGSQTDPASGKEMLIREIFTAPDDKHQHLEMYTTVDGKEFKNMEINFTKK